jgi:molybdate transport system substrate-binding protein
VLALCAVLLPGAGRADDLTVAAAANVRPALEQIATAFEKKMGTTITISYGASGLLERQIENGAPFDVFLSADAGHLDRLEERHLVLAGSRVFYARGVLVLAISHNSGMDIRRLADLARSPLRRIALANPQTAPYGEAARETLVRMGLWDRFQGRVVYAENVRDALRYAETGDADYAFAALSEAMGSNLRFLRVPDDLHAPIRQQGAVLKASAQSSRAVAFLRYLAGPDARAIWDRFGYGAP